VADGLDAYVESVKLFRLLTELWRSLTGGDRDGSGPSGRAPADEETSAGRASILILGPGGVGKTTLGRLFCGDYRLLIEDPGRYVESIDIEKYQLSANDDVELIVFPGQEHRREVSWGDVKNQIEQGKIQGILLVSAYGHPPWKSASSHTCCIRVLEEKKPRF
jgi:hypothetical protein